MAYQWNFDFLLQLAPLLLQGLANTAKLWAVALCCGLLIGLVMGILRTAPSRTLRFIGTFYVETIRNTPGLVQLIWVYFALPILTGMQSSAWVAAAVSLSIYTGAYSAEIYRAGIEELPTGQWEAALTLGLPLRRVWLGIVLPQAVRAVLPVLANMVIAMFKETALLSSITIMELLAVGKSIGSINFRYIEPLTIAGVLYFLVSYACARFVRTLESPHVHAR